MHSTTYSKPHGICYSTSHGSTYSESIANRWLSQTQTQTQTQEVLKYLDRVDLGLWSFACLNLEKNSQLSNARTAR